MIIQKPKPNQLARLGDIIFRSRGQTNTAALLQEDAENTIVAVPLFRVRPDAKKVISEFLLWWINQPSSQAYLTSRAKGTMLKILSKQELENLEVNLPSLKQQKRSLTFSVFQCKNSSYLRRSRIAKRYIYKEFWCRCYQNLAGQRVIKNPDSMLQHLF